MKPKTLSEPMDGNSWLRIRHHAKYLKRFFLLGREGFQFRDISKFSPKFVCQNLEPRSDSHHDELSLE